MTFEKNIKHKPVELHIKDYKFTPIKITLKFNEKTDKWDHIESKGVDHDV